MEIQFVWVYTFQYGKTVLKLSFSALWCIDDFLNKLHIGTYCDKIVDGYNHMYITYTYIIWVSLWTLLGKVDLRYVLRFVQIRVIPI